MSHIPIDQTIFFLKEPIGQTIFSLKTIALGNLI